MPLNPETVGKITLPGHAADPGRPLPSSRLVMRPGVLRRCPGSRRVRRSVAKRRRGGSERPRGVGSPSRERLTLDQRSSNWNEGAEASVRRARGAVGREQNRLAGAAAVDRDEPAAPAAAAAVAQVGREAQPDRLDEAALELERAFQRRARSDVRRTRARVVAPVRSSSSTSVLRKHARTRGRHGDRPSTPRPSRDADERPAPACGRARSRPAAAAGTGRARAAGRASSPARLPCKYNRRHGDD